MKKQKMKFNELDKRDIHNKCFSLLAPKQSLLEFCYGSTLESSITNDDDTSADVMGIKEDRNKRISESIDALHFSSSVI
ncbi:CLUMA_CG016705, isoform A [Clunio marinus]|uniref:CLUMA_CG016705, isoform A n=1 Tax=Clunio marinus TaxID=568069 RepID=A0A1J1IU35_9DIPT|nr:CLUMA_CG016705, isoform A [Clunio marinus]